MITGGRYSGWGEGNLRCRRFRRECLPRRAGGNRGRGEGCPWRPGEGCLVIVDSPWSVVMPRCGRRRRGVRRHGLSWWSNVASAAGWWWMAVQRTPQSGIFRPVVARSPASSAAAPAHRSRAVTPSRSRASNKCAGAGGSGRQARGACGLDPAWLGVRLRSRR